MTTSKSSQEPIKVGGAFDARRAVYIVTTAEGILSRYDKQVSKLGFQLREFLLKELKEIIE